MTQISQQLLADAAPEPVIAEFIDQLNRVAVPTVSASEQTRALVARIAATKHLFRVSDLQFQTGLSSRHLQRLFRKFFGVGPKWVLDRFRMFEALDGIHAIGALALADLALRLGNADQAHFTRMFKLTTGAAPGKYAQTHAAAS